MRKFFLLISRKYIIKKLQQMGYKQVSINKLLKALNLPETGLPEYKPPIK